MTKGGPPKGQKRVKGKKGRRRTCLRAFMRNSYGAFRHPTVVLHVARNLINLLCAFFSGWLGSDVRFCTRADRSYQPLPTKEPWGGLIYRHLPTNFMWSERIRTGLPSRWSNSSPPEEGKTEEQWMPVGTNRTWTYFQIEIQGLTGNISFNDEGRRIDFSLDVVEMTVSSKTVKVRERVADEAKMNAMIL